MSDLLLSYYGDDLTGSTDAMEALASRGVETVLFMQEPTEAQRRRFPHARAIGLAGTSRSETSDWMEAHLAPAFAWLKGLGAGLTHYKVCSTFDSSPGIGSIGRAIDIGARTFAQKTTALVVGVPQLQRYTAFGTLFAAFRGTVHRIDRHPVMSRHPVTPMTEADLRLHLERQTDKRVGLIDLAAIVAPDADGRVDAALAGHDAILMLDVAGAETQVAAGRQLLRIAAAGNRFAVGSSGVEYALLAEWQRLGLLPAAPPGFDPPGRVERIAVVSGSCSPTTERQIRHAEADGFTGIALDPRRFAGEGEAAIAEAVEAGLAVLRQGRSVILHTALGPSTDLGADIDRQAGARHAIGRGLGRIQRALVRQAGLKRAVIAGGDTSSHALRQLDVYALTTRLPLPQTPGSPLCTAHSTDTGCDGLEIALKGGQIGRDDYFSAIRDGRG